MNFKKNVYKLLIICCIFFIAIFPSSSFLGQEINSNKDLNIASKKETKNQTLKKLKGLRFSLGFGISLGAFNSLHGINIIGLASSLIEQHPFGFTNLVDQEKSSSKGLPLPIDIELNLNVEYSIPKLPFLFIRSGFNTIIHLPTSNTTTLKLYNLLNSEFVNNLLFGNGNFKKADGTPIRSYEELYNNYTEPIESLLEEVVEEDPLLSNIAEDIKRLLVFNNDEIALNLVTIIFSLEFLLNYQAGINIDITLPFLDVSFGDSGASLSTISIVNPSFETETYGFQLEIPFMFGFDLLRNQKGSFYILAGISYTYGSLYILEKGIGKTPISSRQAPFSITDITIFNPSGSLGRLQLSNVEISNTFISHSLGIGAGIGGRFNITKNIYFFGEMKFMYSMAVASIRKIKGRINIDDSRAEIVSDIIGGIEALIEGSYDEAVDILTEPFVFLLQAIPFSVAGLYEALVPLLSFVFPDIKNDDFFQYESVQLNPFNLLYIRFVMGIGYAF